MEFMIGDEAASPPQAKTAKLDAERPGGPNESHGQSGWARRETEARNLRPVSLPVRLTGEAVSILAMALATLAIGMALHLHVGLDVWAAGATAVLCYAVMLICHAVMPRHYLVDGVPAVGTILRAPGLPVESHAAPPAAAAGYSSSRQRGGPPQAPRSAGKQAGSVEPSRPDAPKSNAERSEATTLNRPGSVEAVPPRMQGVAPGPQHAQRAGASAPSVQQQGAPQQSARPPALSPANPAPSLAEPLSNRGPVTDAASPREADVEMIQGLIRKLADEVNAATRSPPKGAEAAAVISERAISTSLDALKVTAGRMRAQDDAAEQRKLAPSGNTGEVRLSESGRPPEVNARLSALAEALALGRVEVLLDPIVDFHAGRPRHFELYVRLRDEQGRVLDTEQSREEFAGTGMLARIDGARIAHASQIAVRFTGRGRDNALFSTVSGEAISAHKFLDGVAQAYRERRSVAGVLIMSFSQSDVRGFGPREWHALSEFASIGFRYCIAEVMDLDMDYEDLKSRGFDFVKLDADVFLEGLPAGNDVFVPADDVCKHLAGLGLSVIVGGMKDEATAAKVFGFGVLFGQGALFGGARAVKRELITGSGHAAA
ncbi:MAG: EAL domain-containing protein [Alphaproteobacteria bacterium]|nr:EAL domain-containing protein [Alphaproteobacteria bacterium]